MKLIQDVTLLCSVFLLTTAYAANGPLTVSGTYSYSREPSIINNSYWGTSLTDGSYGRQLVNYIPGANGETAVPRPESFVPYLKAKGSSAAFGIDGYIEKQWPLTDGGVLFTTQINNFNYLYKLKYHPSTNTYSVGNNPPAFDNKQAILNMGQREDNIDNTEKTDIRSLHQRSLLVATFNRNDPLLKKEVLFYGEYNISKTQPWVALWKSLDQGETWSKVIQWNTNGSMQTRHIHGVVQNPYNEWIYILLGDADSQAGIVAWDGKSASPTDNTLLVDIAQGKFPGWKAITGSQQVRTGDLLFTPPPPAGDGKCVWIPDVDTLPAGSALFSQRANYDLSGQEATGQVPFMEGIPAILGARSPSGNMYWSSFRISTALEKKIHIWKSIDSGLHWELAAKADTYTDWTSVPQNLYVKYNASSATSGTDFVYLDGRDVEFVNGGQKRGSTVVFTNPISTQPAPVANPDTLTTLTGKAKTIDITSNDLNVAGSVLSITTPASYGTLSNVSPGIYTYTPNLGFAGEDAFTYTLQGASGTSTAKVTLYVMAAQKDTYTLVADKSRSQFVSVSASNGVAKNDLPTNMAGLSFKVVSAIKRIAGSGKGTITLNFDNTTGSFNYTLTAPAWANSDSKIQAAKRGIYQFSYTTTLNGVTTPPTAVTITVN